MSLFLSLYVSPLSISMSLFLSLCVSSLYLYVSLCLSLSLCLLPVSYACCSLSPRLILSVSPYGSLSPLVYEGAAGGIWNLFLLLKMPANKP